MSERQKWGQLEMPSFFSVCGLTLWILFSGSVPTFLRIQIPADSQTLQEWEYSLKIQIKTALNWGVQRLEWIKMKHFQIPLRRSQQSHISQLKELTNGNSLMGYISALLPKAQHHWWGTGIGGGIFFILSSFHNWFGLKLRGPSLPLTIEARLGETWRTWLQTHPSNRSHTLTESDEEPLSYEWLFQFAECHHLERKNEVKF